MRSPRALDTNTHELFDAHRWDDDKTEVLPRGRHSYVDFDDDSTDPIEVRVDRRVSTLRPPPRVATPPRPRPVRQESRATPPTLDPRIVAVSVALSVVGAGAAIYLFV
jgi:hypothetical protein